MMLNCYAERHYDTAVVDPGGFVSARIKADVYSNALQWLEVQSSLLKPLQTVVNTTEVRHCRGRFGIGGGASWWYANPLVSLHVNLSYVSKKHFGIGVQADPLIGYVGASGIYYFGR
jgi:hypothetical protein